MIIVQVCLFRRVRFQRSCIISLFQLASGKVPFPGRMGETLCNLVPGERPQKPYPIEAPGFTPDVWKIAEMCWDQNPKKRPAVRTVLRHFEGLVNGGGYACASTGDPCMTFFFFRRQRVPRGGLYGWEDFRSCANYVWVETELFLTAGMGVVIIVTA